MRINYKQGCSLILLALMSFSLSLTHGADEDPYPSIMIPIYPTGHNIITRVNRFNGTKSVTYDVQSKYPANTVLEFYDSHFNTSDWRLCYEICQRQWDRFIDETIKGGPLVRQLVYSWDHQKFDLRVYLRLRHEQVNHQWREDVMVTYRIEPKVDKKKLEKFINQLKASGQYAEFSHMLDSYRQENGDPDLTRIAKDIAEHKADEKLIEYQNIIDEIYQEIQRIINTVNKTR